MASIVVAGDTSGSVTLSAPAVAGTTTLTLPTANGTILTTGSSGQSIPKAALPTGSVLQVVNGTSSSIITNSATPVDTGIFVTITPTSASSYVLIMCCTTMTNTSLTYVVYPYIYRNSTQLIQLGGTQLVANGASGGYCWAPLTLVYKDAPNTTSSITYRIYVSTTGGSAYFGSLSTTTIYAMEIAG
jgi:hypothetical protein